MTTSKKAFKVKPYIFAAALTNVIEWYDFGLYLFLAKWFGQIFFNHLPIDSLTISYLILAISFVMRIVGATVWGYIGDRFGRKQALLATLGLMIICCLGTALLPTSENYLGLSAIFLIIFRLLQGFATGGDFNGILTYVMEHVAPEQRGFYGGCLWGLSIAGLFLASLATTLLLSFTSNHFFMQYGWRILYFSGFVLGAMLMVLRFYFKETPTFQKLHQEKQLLMNAPVVAVKQYRQAMFVIFCLSAFVAIPGYFNFTFLPVYAANHFGIHLNTTFFLNNISLLLFIATLIIGGYITDKLQQLKIAWLSCFVLILLVMPLFDVLKKGGMIQFFSFQLLIVLCSGFLVGGLPKLMNDLIPAQVRYSVTAISYNLGLGLFGGFTPLLAKLLAEQGHSPAWLIVFSCGLTMMGLAILTHDHNCCAR